MSPGDEIPASIRELLAAKGGAAGFDEFMDAALYDSRCGYYGSGRARIGTRNGGDFFTNASVGAIYGEILAGQIAETWRNLGKPVPFVVYEQGANDGRLMADVLATLEEDAELFPAIRVHIIEPNALLQSRQTETLDPWREILSWSAEPPLSPAGHGFFFANELIDAFPFALVQHNGCEWVERVIRWDAAGSLCWDIRPAAGWLARRLRNEDVPEEQPFLLEVFRDLPGWAQETARLFHKGVILLCDYGFSREVHRAKPRPEGTFQCYSSHRRDALPLVDIGSKDITAHVDFTEVEEQLCGAGFSRLGFLDQHHFLVGAATPMLRRIESEGLSPATQKKLRQLQTLLHPETMGTSFQFLLMGKNLPHGFSLSGLRHAGKSACGERVGSALPS